MTHKSSLLCANLVERQRQMMSFLHSYLGYNVASKFTERLPKVSVASVSVRLISTPPHHPHERTQVAPCAVLPESTFCPVFSLLFPLYGRCRELIGQCRLYRKIGKSKNGNSVFCHQRHALSISFDVLVVTYRVTNFLPKLVNMLLFSVEKTEFPFLVFPYFWVMLSMSDNMESDRKRDPENVVQRKIVSGTICQKWGQNKESHLPGVRLLCFVNVPLMGEHILRTEALTIGPLPRVPVILFVVCDAFGPGESCASHHRGVPEVASSLPDANTATTFVSVNIGKQVLKSQSRARINATCNANDGSLRVG